MKYFILLILVTVYVLFGKELGYTLHSSIYTHITFHFQHASILHLLINSLTFISIYTALERFVNKWIFLPVSFICSTLASFVAIYDIPTVGISGIIYVMIGLFIGISVFSKKAKIEDIKKYLLFILSIAICLFIGHIRGNSNIPLHVYSLMLGFFCSVPYTIYTNRLK